MSALPCGMSAFAQTDNPLTDEVWRLKNLSILEQSEKGIEQAKKLSYGFSPKQEAVKEIASGEAKQLISMITIDMNEQHLNIDFQPVIERYVNKMLTRKQIFELVKELTDILYHAGYVTSGIGLKSRDISSGHLNLIIHWGVMNDYLVNSAKPKKFKDKAMLKTLPFIKNKVLNIYDVDQIIEILNTYNKSVSVKVVPAELQRNSNLDIELIRRNYPLLNLSLNNSGSENNANGRNQATVGLSGSDLLGINDSWVFSTSYRFYKESKQNNQRNYTLSYTQPIGYSSLELKVSKSDFKKYLKGNNGNYSSSGENKNLNVKFSHILLRNKETILSAYLDTEFKKRKNYLIGRLTQNQLNNKLTIGLSYITNLFDSKIYSDFSYSNGLNWFNANKGAYNHQEDKTLNIFNANFNWYKPLKLYSKIFDYQLRIAMQYSHNYLYADNQLALGDEYTVRGFKGGVISGDSGFYLSQTLSYPFYLKNKYINKIEPLIGFDIGKIYDKSVHQKQVVSGVAVGLKTNIKPFFIAFTYSQPIRNVVANRLGNSPVYYFNVSASF